MIIDAFNYTSESKTRAAEPSDSAEEYTALIMKNLKLA